MTVVAKSVKPLSDVLEAQRVISLEVAALEALKKTLNDSFTKAIEVLVATKGRVIVTGMGKSGHVARKIAATLSSTGTPALFVHPAEASHGDLGMISINDTVIALSNSGETSELSDVLGDTKRRSLPLIAITSNPQSALASAADVVLPLPKFEEACPLKLAPTTSTTLMMVLGDALATTLLSRKNFSSEDFSAFHPGGRLGQQLLQIKGIMHKENELPLAHPQTLMRDAMLVMTAKRFGCVGIVSEDTGRLLGMITDGDLRRHMSGNLLELKAQDVMTSNPKTIRQNALAQEALAIMNTKKITSLFVVENTQENKPIGILHIHDCLRAGIS